MIRADKNRALRSKARIVSGIGDSGCSTAVSGKGLEPWFSVSVEIM